MNQKIIQLNVVESLHMPVVVTGTGIAWAGGHTNADSATEFRGHLFNFHEQKLQRVYCHHVSHARPARPLGLER